MRKNLLELLRGSKSQTDMAIKYGVSQQAWSKWENGQSVPENEIMLQMENEYQVPMEVIFLNLLTTK